MAPRRTASQAMEAKEELTAVLLADSFTQRFRPITLEHPKVLFPLAGAAMIDYTLEWLASSNIAEVYVFCSAHAEQIKAHLDAAGWMRQRNFRIQVVVSTACQSAGEALRALDQKDVVKSDFVLVSGDVVANMDLAEALQEHRARRERDKNAIMTMVMRAGVDAAQRRRLGEAGLLVGLDPATQRLLRYEELDPGRPLPRRAALDAHLWGERDCVVVRSDLVDTHIALCAPEVLMAFSDNFDYQNIRRDFVTGVLSEEELGQQLHVHMLRRSYAQRIHNLRSYDAVSRDLLQRWSFPFAPDTNLLPALGPRGPPTFRMARGFVYKEQGVAIARTARIGRSVALGAGTSIEDDAVVEACVVGRGCRVGAGAWLVGSYMGDDVIIGEGAQVASALLCAGVTVHPHAVVRPGAVLSYRVVVGRGHEIPEYARVSLCAPPRGDAVSSYSDDDTEMAAPMGLSKSGTGPPISPGAVSSSADGTPERAPGGPLSGPNHGQPSTAVAAAAAAAAAGRTTDGGPGSGVRFDEAVVGRGGAGYAWPASPRDSAEERARYAIAPPLTLAPPPDEASSDDEGGGTALSEDVPGAAAVDPEVTFKNEVSETFLRCVKMGYDQDLAVIELNGLKIAEDRTFADCARYILTTILTLCLPAPPRCKAEFRDIFSSTPPDVTTPVGRAELVKRLQRLQLTWGPLLQRFLRSEDDQVELLLTLEEFCSEEGVFENTGERGSLFTPVFAQVLQVMYEGDVVEEGALLAWADEKAAAAEDERAFLARASDFITWLREAEEEDSNGEDDGDDDD